MGSCKEERDLSYSKFRKVVNGCMACLALFLISMVGGLILVWWEFEHHPTNSQLWMVPFGLILLVTPIIVWFSAFVSDNCSPIESAAASTTSVPSLNQPVLSLDISARDTDR